MLIIYFALWLPAHLFTTQPTHLPLRSTIPKAAAVANHGRGGVVHISWLHSGVSVGFGLQCSWSYVWRTATRLKPQSDEVNDQTSTGCNDS